MDAPGLKEEMQGIRKTLAWMDLVLANLSEGVFVVDQNWKIVFTNDSLAELIGSERIFLLGQTIWQAIPLTRQNQDLSQIITLGQSIDNIESWQGVYNLKVGKTSRLVYLSAKYVENLDQAVCVLSDVTIEMRAEQALKNMSDQIAELNAQLDQSRSTYLRQTSPKQIFSAAVMLFIFIGVLFQVNSVFDRKRSAQEKRKRRL
jgi:PAS domain S-box-containing protein